VKRTCWQGRISASFVQDNRAQVAISRHAGAFQDTFPHCAAGTVVPRPEQRRHEGVERRARQRQLPLQWQQPAGAPAVWAPRAGAAGSARALAGAPPVGRRNQLGACTGRPAPEGGPQRRRAHPQPMQGAPQPASPRSPTDPQWRKGDSPHVGAAPATGSGGAAASARRPWRGGARGVRGTRAAPHRRSGRRPSQGGAAGVGGRRGERRSATTRARLFWRSAVQSAGRPPVPGCVVRSVAAAWKAVARRAPGQDAR